MWDEELDFSDSPLTVGNIVDIIGQDGIREMSEIVKVHCMLCAETFIGPKDKAGMFIKGHKEYHLWETTLYDTLGGP